MGFTLVTVTGDYLDPDGNPASGGVEFQLCSTMIDATGHVMVAASPQFGILNDLGQLNIQLYSNEDSTTTPTGTFYTVTEYVGNQQQPSYDIYVPVISTIDLSDIVHIQGSGGFASGGLADEQVIRAQTLNQMAIPTGDLNMNSQRINALSPGVDPNDVASLFNMAFQPWAIDSNAWVFSSGSGTAGNVFTIANSTFLLQYFYPPGLKLKWQDGGGWKYGVVASASFSGSTTTVNMVPTTDYVMANSIVSGTPQYATTWPVDFPTKFAYTPTITGFSTAPTISAWWAINGGICTVSLLTLLAGADSAAAPVTVSAPIESQQFGQCNGFGLNGGSWVSLIAAIGGTGSTINVGPLSTGLATSNWTADGTAQTKSLNFQLAYPIINPDVGVAV